MRDILKKSTAIITAGVLCLLAGNVVYGGEDISAERMVPVSEPIVSVKVSAAGDCTLGSDANFSYASSLPAMYDSVKNPEYFLGGVAPVFSQDDLTIVNLEGTLSLNGSRQDKTYAFRGDPEYVGILTSGSVEACNLANNHSRDYGEISYTDTIENVEAVGIPTFGLKRTQIMDINGIPVGLVGVYELPYGIGCKETLIKDIENVKSQGARLILVSFHWGIEREYYPRDVQISLAHAAIDNGADLVIGHHPHVLQGMERYKGKYICYSLGNFCFGGNKNPSDKDTMIFTQTFNFIDDELVSGEGRNISRGISWDLNSGNESGAGSLVYDMENDGAKIYPCSVSSVKSRNDYRPTLLEGDEANRVLSKVEEYSKKFY